MGFTKGIYLILVMSFLVLFYSPVAGDEVKNLTGAYLDEDYLIGSGDVIEISIWRNEDLSRVVVVRPDGKISLPLMGEIKVSGLTPLKLRSLILQKLKEFGETPEATVIIREISSYAVYVLGEVTRPGRFQLNGRTTVVQAIAMAGGFKEFASVNNIILLRKVEGEDEERRARIRYKDIV
jgi:polysaccharide biosynthesis/export protein